MNDTKTTTPAASVPPGQLVAAPTTAFTTVAAALTHIEAVSKKVQEVLKDYAGKPGYNPFLMKGKLDDLKAILNSKDAEVAKAGIVSASSLSLSESDFKVSYEQPTKPSVDVGTTVVKPPE